MAKDPAVLFYYQDFLVGTSFMTEASVGAYIRILCHLYDKDRLSEKHMLSICSTNDIWNSVKEKFDRDPDGYYFHARAREEKKKRVRFTESRRLNAKKTTSDGKHMQSTSKASASHMEDENEDEDINVINHEKGVENKISPEGIMFRCWNRKCKNLEEQRLLKKAFIAAGEDPKILEAAFRQSVKYNKYSFAYLDGVLKGMKKDADLAAAKIREDEARVKKIQDQKEYTPDPELLKVLKDAVDSVQPGKKTKKEVAGKTVAEKLNRKRLVDEFNREVEKGK
jgi:hypothetical protein